MQLYWQQTFGSGWGVESNWWEDAAATVPHAALPISGDDVDYATGETGIAVIDQDAGLGSLTVSLGVGVCNIAVTVASGATIASGTFNGAVINNGTILGGSFPAFVIFSGNSTTVAGAFSGDGCYTVDTATITGGTFSGGNFVHGTDGAGPIITGGTFSGTNFISKASITGGTFTGVPVTLQGNTVSNGTFSGDGELIASGGSISGGTYTMGKYTVSAGEVSGGTFGPNSSFQQCLLSGTGRISGGTWSVSVYITGGGASITGGTFTGAGSGLADGAITGGTFTGLNFSFDGGTISGTAAYAPHGTVAYADLIVTGDLALAQVATSLAQIHDPSGAFTALAGYSPIITVTDLPAGGADILATGLL